MRSMNILLLLQYILAFAMAIVPDYSSAQSRPLKNENYQSFLSEFNRGYETALLNGTPEILDKYWANDLRLMPEYQKTVMKKLNAMTYQKAFLDRFEVKKYERRELETLDLGSMIVEFGTFIMELKLKETGAEYTLLGNYGTFWKARDGKDLKLVTETWNYSKQVECAPQLVFDQVPVVDIAMEGHLPIKNHLDFEIKAINSFTEEIITHHDDYLWSQLYEDDSKLIYSNHPVFSGKEEITAFLEDHVKHLPVFEKLDIRTDQIDNLGEYIIEYSSHIAMVRDGDWSGVGTGKNIVIWKRQPDCSLKIFRSMAMYD